MRIILSRTDSIGDVVLTLPMAGVLKQFIPDCTIIFLGSEYTRPVVSLCCHVDEFVTWKSGNSVALLSGVQADVIIHVFPVREICIAASKARIPLRVATAGRFFTWFTCNRLLHIPRKNSTLHESQLNLKLLKVLDVAVEMPLEQISSYYGLSVNAFDFQTINIEPGVGIEKRKIILHPKSKGSAREWGLDNFSRLIALLPAEKNTIFITGTREEGLMMAPFLEKHRGLVCDLTGKLSLSEYISLIASSDALVAASTGPLHLAAALGIRAVGIYAPMRPIFPQRWAPVGTRATFLVMDTECNKCRKTRDCECIRNISPEEVVRALTDCQASSDLLRNV